MPQDSPARFVPISAIDRVGKEAFLEMRPGQFEKCLGAHRTKLIGRSDFEERYQVALAFGFQAQKIEPVMGEGFSIKCDDAKPVGFNMARVRTAKRTIEVLHNANRSCAGSIFIGREEVFEKDLEDFGFGLV